MMNHLKKDIIKLLRKNSRSNLASFSKFKKINNKKVHYEYRKIKKEFDKFVPVLDFEKLGFKRMFVLFHDAIEGLTFCSKSRKFFINNSFRLNKGLLVEFIFFFEEEKQYFLNFIKKNKLSFEYYLINDVLKQEEFISF